MSSILVQRPVAATLDPRVANTRASLSSALQHVARGLVEQDPPFGVARRGRAAQLLAEIDAALHRWALLDRLAPPRDPGKIVERLAQWLGDQHPGPRRHVGDRILVENELAAAQPALEHPEAAVVLVGIALVRVRVLARRVIDEMAQLPGHRAEIADLPEEPLQALLAATPAQRHEPSGPLGEMDQDGARLEERHRPVAKLAWGIVIDDRRHPVVRADRQEVGLELVAAPDVDRDHAIFETAFLEHDRDLPPVRGRPVIKVDHLLPPAQSPAISSAE